MKKQNNIPHLRFRDFCTEWHSKTIDKLVEDKIIAKPIDGNHGNLHPKSTDYVQGGIPFIMACDIKEGYVDLVNCKFLNKELSDKLQKGFAKVGDVLLTHKGSIGEVAIVPESVEDYIMLTPQVTYYRVLNKNLINNFFLSYIFNTSYFQKNLRLLADSGTRPYIGITEQRNLHISLTSIAEQHKIASFFTVIDQKISQLKRKKNLLEQYKKGVMQKIFSQEIRFKDDKGQEFPKWEKKKLGDVAKNISSGKSKIRNSTGEFPLYGSTGIIGYSNNYEYSGKNILIARVGANAGTLYKVKGNYSVTDNTLILNLLNEIDADFIYYFLIEIKLNRLVFGSGQPLITGGQLNNLKLSLPTLPEQKKIADFLSAIDDKINQSQKQIEKAETWKKGLLQMMFV